MPPEPVYGHGLSPPLRNRPLKQDLARTGPSKRPEYCDERLRHLDITPWTSVPVSNEFAADVISLFLETDHPIQGLFDADLFLNDLVNSLHRFCSRLLVSSLLFVGCVSLHPISARSCGLM